MRNENGMTSIINNVSVTEILRNLLKRTKDLEFRLENSTVRLFLSSTFHDMSAERDQLITAVYPELEERLAFLNIDFFDVDL